VSKGIANQARVGRQRARVGSKRRRVDKELEERVAQRASELATANEALRESERNWRLVLDNIPGMVAVLAADGTAQFVNRRIIEYTGMTRVEEYKEWGTNGTLHPEDLAHVAEAFTKSLASGSPYQIVHRVRRSDGVYRWFQSSGVQCRDASGQTVQWCSVLTDFDERKRAEDALRERERESRLIVNSIPGLVATLTPAGEVELVNDQVLQYCGGTLREMRQWATNGTVHPEDLAHAVDVIGQSMMSGDAYEIIERLRRFDGIYRWFQVRGLPFRDSGGRIVRWYVLLTDIDDLKRAEEALRESERESRLIVDSIPGLVVALAHDGEVEFVNGQGLEFFGLPLEELKHWGTNGAIHPEDLPQLMEDFTQAIASGQPFEWEVRGRRFDGVYRWFQSRGYPLRDPSGRIVRWYNLLTDIHDRKRAEEELRRAYDSFADAQRLSKTGSFITDLVADEHRWSDETLRIFEFDSATKVTSQRIRDMVHPDDLPSFDSVMARAMTGSDVTFGFRIVTAQGAVKNIRGVAHVIDQIEGRPMFVGALQDVTERMEAEEALNKARSELAHVARVTTVSALTASIAHEINQPLSGIITNAGTCLRMLAADPPDVDGARETAKRTIRDGNRASDVITRLRALFSKKEFALESLDLNDATREVIALSLSDLQRQRVVLQSEFADDLPNVTGDRVQLQQVILNLVRNASDAMMDVDDRPRQLLVRTERENGDRVRVTVRDSGIGVDRQSMNKLFDAFYTTKSGGMGIGLSVSRSIVERHHGRLWAEPNDGPGATFSFSIPLEPIPRSHGR
jgi:PAS domain S-box-containing protein